MVPWMGQGYPSGTDCARSRLEAAMTSYALYCPTGRTSLPLFVAEVTATCQNRLTHRPKQRKATPTCLAPAELCDASYAGPTTALLLVCCPGANATLHAWLQSRLPPTHWREFE